MFCELVKVASQGQRAESGPTLCPELSIAAESSGPGEESARHQRTPIPTFPRDSNPPSRVASPAPTPPPSLNLRDGQRPKATVDAKAPSRRY